MGVKNLTGHTFGSWTVLNDSGKRSKDRRVKWQCRCACGKEQLVTTRHLTGGRSTGCSRCVHRLPPNTVREIDAGSVYVLCPDDKLFIADKNAIPLLEPYHWRIENGYAKSNTFGRRVSAARLILGLDGNNDLMVDHISGDTLDNRKTNLRACTNLENTRNKKVRADSQTGYRGVSYRPRSKKYIARISPCPGERIFLGYFSTPEEAAAAYDRAALLYHGDFARTNKMLGLLGGHNENN